MLFLDPQVRGRDAEWHPIARTCVGFVRAAADGVVEPRLAELAGDLSLRDADFHTWWAERHAGYQTRGTKILIHPEHGRYTLGWQLLLSPDDNQALMVMTAPPDGAGRDVLGHPRCDGRGGHGTRRVWRALMRRA